MGTPMFQMSADARLLMQHMAAASIGETVTYTELGKVISRPVSGAFGALRTALRRLLKDEDMVFSAVKGIGIKRLNDAEIVAEGGTAAIAIRRKASRSIERQMKVDFSKLTRESQSRFTAQVSVMASVAMMTRDKSLDRIAAASTPQIKELPIAETLAMFAK